MVQHVPPLLLLRVGGSRLRSVAELFRHPLGRARLVGLVRVVGAHCHKLLLLLADGWHKQSPLVG